MRKRKTAFWCAAALLLAGCAKSPENDIVTQKNTEALVSKAEQEDENRKTLAENKEQAPEHYTWSYDNKDGTLHMEADADVTLPEADTIPMYRLRCTGFTQEQVTGVYDYVFKGQETYTIEGSDYTKEKCEEDIVQLRRRLEELERDTENDPEFIEQEKETAQQQIDDLTAAYDSLPDESNLKKVPVDSTLTDKTWQVLKGDESVEEVYPGLDCQSDNKDFLSVNNTPVDSPGWPDLSYQKEGKYNYSPDGGITVTPQDADEKKSPELAYSYEEAKALADGVTAAAGVEAELVETKLLKGYTESGSEETNDVKIDNSDDYTAFRFYYTRIVDGTPVAATTSSEVPDDETALTWPYEQITVDVTEAGIQNIRWDSPVALDETVANDVPILSFEDAKGVFEELAPLAHEGELEKFGDEYTTSKMDVKVNQVRLGLMRVKNDGSKREGLYVPAWLFYGSKAMTFHTDYPDTPENERDWTNQEDTPWIVLAVNAVDGTVIDQVEGY